jgi:hypothetical protein
MFVCMNKTQLCILHNSREYLYGVVGFPISWTLYVLFGSEMYEG